MTTNNQIDISQLTYAKAIALVKKQANSDDFKRLLFTIHNSKQTVKKAEALENYDLAFVTITSHLISLAHEITDLKYTRSQEGGKVHIEIQDDFSGLDKSYLAFDLLCSNRGNYEHLVHAAKNLKELCPNCVNALLSIKEDQELIDKHVAIKAKTA